MESISEDMDSNITKRIGFIVLVASRFSDELSRLIVSEALYYPWKDGHIMLRGTGASKAVGPSGHIEKRYNPDSVVSSYAEGLTRELINESIGKVIHLSGDKSSSHPSSLCSYNYETAEEDEEQISSDYLRNTSGDTEGISMKVVVFSDGAQDVTQETLAIGNRVGLPRPTYLHLDSVKLGEEFPERDHDLKWIPSYSTNLATGIIQQALSSLNYDSNVNDNDFGAFSGLQNEWISCLAEGLVADATQQALEEYLETQWECNSEKSINNSRSPSSISLESDDGNVIAEFYSVYDVTTLSLFAETLVNEALEKALAVYDPQISLSVIPVSVESDHEFCKHVGSTDTPEGFVMDNSSKERAVHFKEPRIKFAIDGGKSVKSEDATGKTECQENPLSLVSQEDEWSTTSTEEEGRDLCGLGCLILSFCCTRK